MDRAFADNGLDRHTGPGKAIATAYEGEPTTEAVAQHLLNEYDHTLESAPNPIAASISTAQSQLDHAAAGAGSVSVPTQDDILAQAEAKGDWAATLETKSDQLERLLGN